MASFHICEVTGKRGYKSRQAAKDAHRTASFRIKLYKCEGCGLWHATNLEKR